MLSALLPEGVSGSISTLPGAFKPRGAHARRRARDRRAPALRRAPARDPPNAPANASRSRSNPNRAASSRRSTKPSPSSREHLHSERARARLHALTGADAHELLARHLGLCLDACHAAVEFEAPREVAATLRAAAIPVAKIQLSSGLRIAHVDAEAIAALAPYADPVYLHQVVERRAGALNRYLDLPDALAAFARDPGGAAREWRIHFHVPIFLDRLRHFDSTQAFLRELLALQRESPLSAQLEVETYTWDVLPDEARPAGLTEAIARELRFCMAQLGASV